MTLNAEMRDSPPDCQQRRFHCRKPPHYSLTLVLQMLGGHRPHINAHNGKEQTNRLGESSNLQALHGVATRALRLLPYRPYGESKNMGARCDCQLEGYRDGNFNFFFLRNIFRKIYFLFRKVYFSPGIEKNTISYTGGKWNSTLRLRLGCHVTHVRKLHFSPL